MLFFYIRHGDPIYNPNKLTPLGERQAEAVAKRLALYGIDRIYSSPSNRAIQTAQPTCEILKKDMTLLVMNISVTVECTKPFAPIMSALPFSPMVDLVELL